MSHAPRILLKMFCNFHFEQVGIVGRTGAGKSSFISSLFRIVEPSSGSIHIDSVNTLELGLHDLRSKISIIPQNSFLFSGTIRQNLDPVGKYSDAKLWTVLQHVQLVDRLGLSKNGNGAAHGLDTLVCMYRVPNNLCCPTPPGEKLGHWNG